jgi:hypothetical protein
MYICWASSGVHEAKSLLNVLELVGSSTYLAKAPICTNDTTRDGIVAAIERPINVPNE